MALFIRIVGCGQTDSMIGHSVSNIGIYAVSDTTLNGDTLQLIRGLIKLWIQDEKDLNKTRDALMNEYESEMAEGQIMRDLIKPKKQEKNQKHESNYHHGDSTMPY